MTALWRWIWSKRYRRYGTMAALGFAVFSVASVEMTSQPWFCNSCHIMGSYYDSWHASSHREVDCVQCHIAPGVDHFLSAKLNGLGQVVDDLLHRTSTKPSASVSDFACTRAGCHNMDKVLATGRHEEPFFFEHDKHLRLHYQGIEIHCTTCHSHVKGNEHFEVNTNVCVTCHLAPPAPAVRRIVPVVLPDDQFGPSDDEPVATKVLASVEPTLPRPSNECKTCHEAPDEPLVYQGLKIVHAEYLSYGAACESCHRNVTAAPRPVNDEQCYTCHDFGRERMTNISDNHRIHTTGRHKVECDSCHGITAHGPDAQAMRLDQLDCRACHQKQHEVQRLTYSSNGNGNGNGNGHPNGDGSLAHGLPDAPAVSPMFMVHVDCTGCHVLPANAPLVPVEGSSVAKATAKSCDECHKPGLGERMVPLWQRDTRALYDETVKLLPADDAPPVSQKAGRLVKDARQLLDLVRLDGSWGVHNPRYTQELLQQARVKLLAARGEAQATGTVP